MISTSLVHDPDCVPAFSMSLTTSMPLFTSPKTTCLSSNQSVFNLSCTSWCWHTYLVEADEELRAVGIWTRIRHRKDSRSDMLEVKVFILEFRSVDAFTTSSISLKNDHRTPFWTTNLCNIAALNHEARNDSMKFRALERQSFLGVTFLVFLGNRSSWNPCLSLPSKALWNSCKFSAQYHPGALSLWFQPESHQS